MMESMMNQVMILMMVRVNALYQVAFTLISAAGKADAGDHDPSVEVKGKPQSGK